MRKNYTFGLLILVFLNCFSSFSQVPPPNGGPIDAVAETIIMSCNGSAVGSSVSLVANDTLDGSPVIIGPNGNVTLTNGVLPNGFSVDSFTGIISVTPNTPIGSYQLSYTICEVNQPNNCDTITSTVIVQSCGINAVDDIFNVTLTPNGATTPSLLLNDTLNGVTATLNSVTITPLSFLNYFSVNPNNGGLFISSDTPSGTYTFSYEICQLNTQPANCSIAAFVLIVNNPIFNASMQGTYADYNNDGFVNVGDVINYQIILTNNGSTPITNLVPCQSSLTVNGTLSSLPPNSTDTISFTGFHVITQENINAGNVFDFICICGDNGVQDCFDGFNTVLAVSDGIKLNAFIDLNNNGIKESNEQNFPHGNFNYSVNGGATTNLYSYNGIAYLYESNPATSYNLSFSLPSQYSGFYTCNATYTNVNVSVGSGITTYNFPITVTPYTDLAVYVHPYGASPRPGFTYMNRVTIVNQGNQTIAAGSVTFDKSNIVTITNVFPSVTNTPTGFIGSFTNLAPFQSKEFIVTMQVPTIPTVSLGQIITNTALVTIPTNDAIVSNNTSTISQVIVGSYDPNDKQESHGGKILHSSFTANDYLNYTIRFENTGTAEAINIRVEDILDSKLDENSIRMVASSHPYVLDRVGSNLNWNFNGVNLPPSIPNTQTGHGYIVFQVKPKSGFAIGDVIPNTANIYFDFNPAIVTNTCTTEFVSTLANENFTFNNFKSFPNPVKNTLKISNASPIETIEISSILGQKMISKKVNDIQTEIDLSQLSNGIYFVKVTSQGSEKTIKIVKE
ncbi:MAG: T9SS type A sorting domain-containing protein [Flavobacterium sp.]|uniref:T9SS type A sorting domain-containing protein n=1 Tax=Flavobacterium sp. TaxID=239 RepID=UPI0022C1ECCD|nr:T9SS type A sorting domain-containing protein [Flavobacterium sp.]MCZ8196142.1 T9SS type A sorting domain-containing protein [Flavobacterium sp.]